LPRPERFFGGSGPVPGTHTVVVDWIPATYVNPSLTP
jgi:hypothetical protein